MFGDISVTKLLIILVIVIALFGTKKLKSIGKDLGGAVKGFKEAMDDGEKEGEKSQAEPQEQITQQQQKPPSKDDAASKREDQV